MFNPLKLIPTGVSTAQDKATTKVASVALRAPLGLYILNAGLGKFNSDEEAAQGLQDMAATGLPFVKEIEPKNFASLLAAGETALGAALLLPFIPNRLAGLGLTAFSAGLLSMYFGNPDMTEDDGIRPSQSGTSLAKDSWLGAAGVALMALPKK
ncbi:DoxX family membrane protein [Corynebacterium timonense]|uniref:DoxX protein n=1 Tax=Corynebacterium timonense TaxID=441500 RepID=A0A1H1U9Y0_9CORY|nr:DoxX family membrane protein [Corynebacterium timonense]SDS69270.1 DoxX protein [Corynebacterium timonense]